MFASLPLTKVVKSSMAKGIKTGGRSEGTPNKITKDIREQLKEILEGEIDNLPTYLNGLEGRDRIEMIIRLLPYVTPKLKETNEKEQFVPQPLFPDIRPISVKYEAVCPVYDSGTQTG